MTSTKFDVFPTKPNKCNRRIVLPGIDLWIAPRIDNVFVYPQTLNIDLFIEAMENTLNLWPIVSGRFHLDGTDYILDLCNKAIPLTIVDNTVLRRYPSISCVLLNDEDEQLSPFLDVVKTNHLWDESNDESLVRFKITRIAQSGQCVLGISWAHVLGDAFTCLHFLHTISSFYQKIDSLFPLPIFERPLWHKNDADYTLLPSMRHLSDSLSAAGIEKRSLQERATHQHLNIQFSGEQLATLYKHANDLSLTVHDVLVAYIILTLNTSSLGMNETIIRHTNNIANYRNVADSIASANLAANCTLRVISENFTDPLSLLSIAKAIRSSISNFRNVDFLRSWLSTADVLMKGLAKTRHHVNVDHFENGIVINSNYRYDWAALVDFGYPGMCQFYTDGSSNLFLRIFRLNPIHDGEKWLLRDTNGAEIGFRLKKEHVKSFQDAIERDTREKFANVNL